MRLNDGADRGKEAREWKYEAGGARLMEAGWRLVAIGLWLATERCGLRVVAGSPEAWMRPVTTCYCCQ